MQAQSQSKGPPRYKSSLQAYRTIFSSEGARGLWKGRWIVRHSYTNASLMTFIPLHPAFKSGARRESGIETTLTQFFRRIWQGCRIFLLSVWWADYHHLWPKAVDLARCPLIWQRSLPPGRTDETTCVIIDPPPSPSVKGTLTGVLTRAPT